jgi:hypothetical protein
MSCGDAEVGGTGGGMLIRGRGRQECRMFWASRPPRQYELHLELLCSDLHASVRCPRCSARINFELEKLAALPRMANFVPLNTMGHICGCMLDGTLCIGSL